FDLSKRLSENKIICNALQREKERLEGENDEQKWWSVPVLDPCF
ncbi:CALCOCO2 isoform 27, partial [Pan troglodytes]